MQKTLAKKLKRTESLPVKQRRPPEIEVIPNEDVPKQYKPSVLDLTQAPTVGVEKDRSSELKVPKTMVSASKCEKGIAEEIKLKSKQLVKNPVHIDAEMPTTEHSTTTTLPDSKEVSISIDGQRSTQELKTKKNPAYVEMSFIPLKTDSKTTESTIDIKAVHFPEDTQHTNSDLEWSSVKNPAYIDLSSIKEPNTTTTERKKLPGQLPIAERLKLLYTDREKSPACAETAPSSRSAVEKSREVLPRQNKDRKTLPLPKTPLDEMLDKHRSTSPLHQSINPSFEQASDESSAMRGNFRSKNDLRKDYKHRPPPKLPGSSGQGQVDSLKSDKPKVSLKPEKRNLPSTPTNIYETIPLARSTAERTTTKPPVKPKPKPLVRSKFQDLPLILPLKDTMLQKDKLQTSTTTKSHTLPRSFSIDCLAEQDAKGRYKPLVPKGKKQPKVESSVYEYID